MPHCRWTVEIDPAFDPVSPAPEPRARRGVAHRGHRRRRRRTGELEPGGWDDYNRDFDPDFQLEDFSHRALVVALQEFAVQSHLLFRVVPARPSRSGSARRRRRASTRWCSPASPGSPRSDCAPAMKIDGDGADAIAKVLQLHPVFYPRTYVDIAVEVVADDRVRFAILDSPVFAEADDYHWFAQLGGASDRALDAIVQAVNPRASVSRRRRARAGERFAYEAVIDPNATPAREAPEIGLAKISTGATVEFSPRRPVRAART